MLSGWWKVAMLAVLTAAVSGLQGCAGRNYYNVGSAPESVTLDAIQITPSTSLLLLAGSRQLAAIGVYSDGSTDDITSKVTWAASAAPGTATGSSYISVNSGGMVTGTAVGAGVVSASLGPVTGLLQLIVNTNGYSSNTTAILAIPYKNSQIDAAYMPNSKAQIQGTYSVQVVNLDADQSSSVFPVQLALLDSIRMPADFVPNATAASQASSKVAVISYSSPNVQIIDANLDPLDLTGTRLKNTVTATYIAPVSKTVTFNGVSCIICAAVVNPLTDQLLLSTAQGYYSMSISSGAFTALPFKPAALPAPSFSLDPVAASPYILSPTYGHDSQSPGEVQILNLTTNVTTTDTSTGVATPGSTALDPFTNYAVIADATANTQSLFTLTDPQNPISNVVSNVALCAAQPPSLNMVALGISANLVASNAAHTLFSSQTGGNCIGIAVWPNVPSATPIDASQVFFGYGPLPATPDGNPFLNGSDPSAIAAFTSVVDKKNYGFLIDANQTWVSKIDFATLFSESGIGPVNSPSLPSATLIPTDFLHATLASDPIKYLPTPLTAATVSATSLDFGSPNVGTATPPVTVTLTYINSNVPDPNADPNLADVLNISSIAIQGTNSGDFTETDTCPAQLLPQSKCLINIIFTPSATGARSATLTIADDGSATPQTVTLTGSGT